MTDLTDPRLNRSDTIRAVLDEITRPDGWTLSVDYVHHGATAEQLQAADPDYTGDGYDYWAYRITAETPMSDGTVETTFLDLPREVEGEPRIWRVLAIGALLGLIGRVQERVPEA